MPILWIVIYPVDSAIRFLNNRGQDFWNILAAFSADTLGTKGSLAVYAFVRSRGQRDMRGVKLERDESAKKASSTHSKRNSLPML